MNKKTLQDSGHRINARAQIIAAIILATGAIIVGWWQYNQSKPVVSEPPPQKHPQPKFVGRVINVDTKAPVSDAEVTLEIKDVPSVTRTDSRGIFSFPIDEHTGEVRIRVYAVGYEDFNERIVPSSNTGIKDIRIRLLQKGPESKPKKGNDSSQNGPKAPSQAPANVPTKKKFEFEISSTIYEDGMKIFIDNEKTPRVIIKGGESTFLQIEKGLHVLKAVKTLKDNTEKTFEKQISVPEDSPLYLFKLKQL